MQHRQPNKLNSAMDAIARLMNEDFGSPSIMANSDGAQMAPTQLDDADVGHGCGNEEPDGFQEEELRMAKRFVELMGSAERAREAVDRVDQCEECLDLIDDDSSIEAIATMVPLSPDMPSGKAIEMSTLYNPPGSQVAQGNY